MPRGQYKAWKDSEIALLLELRSDEGMEWREIAAEIGHTQESCKQKYYGIKYRQRAERPAFKMFSNAALLDRDRRQAARDQRDDAAFARGDVTAAFFGDPPPGYSALDRRRA